MNKIIRAQFHYVVLRYENLNYHHLCFFLNNRQKIYEIVCVDEEKYFRYLSQ